jgi:NADP-dependent 3-hydroxy acid dehydrogenase YdfG
LFRGVEDRLPSALITGTLAGIGRPTAPAFVRNNARIVNSGRRVDEGASIYVA